MSTREAISWPRVCGAVALVIFAFAISRCTVDYVRDASAVVARSAR